MSTGADIEIGGVLSARVPPVATVPADGAWRLPRIDILRGLAALAVFMFHASGALGFPKRTLPPFEWFGQTWSTVPSVFSFGATGVSLFFVLSGFCLSLQPLRRQLRGLDLPRYYRDRVARIYPAYVVAVLFSIIVTQWLGTPWTAGEAGAFFLFLHGLIQPWVFSFNGALWSMSTEVQFYLVFPLLFALLASAKRRSSFLIGAVLVVLLARFAFTQTPGAAIVSGGITGSALLMNTLPGRLLEFALGMLVAHWMLDDKPALWRFCRLALLPAVLLGLWSRAAGPLWLADPMVGVMYAVIVGAVVARDPGTGDASILASFGRSSYSFFLLHLPVLNAVVALAPWLADVPAYPRFIFLCLMGLAATLPLSLLLYRFVEMPLWRVFKASAARSTV